MRAVPDWPGPLDPRQLPEALLAAERPYRLPGCFKHWPAVQAAQRSDAALCEHLLQHWQGMTVGLFQMPPEAGGRAFYADEQLSHFNFSRHLAPLDQVLQGLLQLASVARPPGLYVGSTTVEAALPGFLDSNPLQLGARDALVSLWLGNRSRIAAHFDVPDNLAVVVAGRRRFTLFPPQQVGNLYIGPLDPTPAGQPISLVDFQAPDFARFPRFADALEAAELAELEPGDALFIPSLWWHHVEALAALNLLINAWWRRSPTHIDTPVSALHLALMTLRDLPAHERQAWQALFQHYVFGADASTWAHIPPAARGLLGTPLEEAPLRQARAHLLNRLKR